MIDQGVIQQVGRPMDLYDHPANRFVAEFVGTNSAGGRDRNRGGTLVNREFLGAAVRYRVETRAGALIADPIELT